jgi:hypothetical protein
VDTTTLGFDIPALNAMEKEAAEAGEKEVVVEKENVSQDPQKDIKGDSSSGAEEIEEESA